MRRNTIATVAIFAAAAVTAVLFWQVLVTISAGKVKTDKPGVEETLYRMPPKTGEETRRYLRVDGKERRLEVVFQDGCTGLRVKDENGKITLLSERKKDGSTLIYSLNDKAAVQSVSVFRKTGTLQTREVMTGPKSGIGEIYYEDGITLRARLEVTEAQYVFTTFDEKGRKRYEKSEGQEEGNDEYGPYGPKRPSMTYLIYNGSATPLYRQVLQSEQYYGGNQQPLKLGYVEEFDEGSMQVVRRITPSKSLYIGFTFEAFTEVVVLTDGKETSVRYLDKWLCIKRIVDKTKTPELVTDISDPKVKEQVDVSRLQSPETPADLKLFAEVQAGATDAHMERMLAP